MSIYVFINAKRMLSHSELNKFKQLTGPCPKSMIGLLAKILTSFLSLSVFVEKFYHI